MNTGYLTPAELEQLDELLFMYGNDDSILSVSELDGFLTGIVSGPEPIVPSTWFPVLWGGADREPNWKSEHEFNEFMGLVIRLMNENVMFLMNAPDQYSALFTVNDHDSGEVFMVEDWCFGYMAAVALGNWPDLPEELEVCLGAISLHGLTENFMALEKLTLEEHQRTVADIEPAALKLHAYWLAQRSDDNLVPAEQVLATEKSQPVSGPAPAGRNEPCPCGSGKKYKRCCLH